MAERQRVTALPEHPVPKDLPARETWRLKIDGLVRQPLDLSAAEVRSLGSNGSTAAFVCKEGWVVSDQQWERVPVGALLLHGGVDAGARYLRALTGEIVQKANEQSRHLRELLHAPEILVMPGAYDTGSALLFEALGFKAIQGSSSGIARVFGLHDGEILRRDAAVQVYVHMVQAVRVPVNADGEKGYGGPEEVAETVRQLVLAGAAGMNLEDSDYHQRGDPIRLLPLDAQLAKIRSFIATKKRLGSAFFLNARVDALLVDPDPKVSLDEAIKRGNAYAENGADCIFFMRAGGAETIRTLVKEVHAPVSILAGASSPSVKELEDLGVARVSYGGAFSSVALSAAKRLAAVLLEKGNPASVLNEAMTGPEMNHFLRDSWPV